MRKNQIKLLAFILASGMFLSGCEMNLQEVEAKLKDKIKGPNPRPTTSPISDSSKETEDIFAGITIPDPEVAVPKEETTQKAPVETERSTEQPTEEQVPTTTPIETELPSAPEPTNSQPTDDIVVHATTKVNIRSGNTTDSVIIGNLELGDAAYRVLSCDNNWDLVRTNDKIGFVCRDYLEYSTETYEDEYKHEIKNDIVLATTELNLRDKPTGDSKQLNRFQQGTELEVVAEVDNGWLLVKYNGQLGYVKSDYTKSMLAEVNSLYPELELTDLGVQKIVYSDTTLNIRNGNSTEYDRIGQLERYESIRVLGEYDDWYLIMTNDHNFGFVSKEYTKDLDELFVIVDKSEQKLYMYNNDELMYVTPVTTGKDSTPSDTGLFKVYAKETDRYLTDGKTYNAHVDYWMPYNGGEGLHDAAWRSVFGTENYHYGGSHGCINIPPKIAGTIYDTVEVGTKVLVHK